MKHIYYIIIGVFITLSIVLGIEVYKFKKETERQQLVIEQLTESIESISKVKAIQLAIYPHIENKVNTTFGSSKNVTLQYYFTIDGNSLLVKPDSIYELTKIQ